MNLNTISPIVSDLDISVGEPDMDGVPPYLATPSASTTKSLTTVSMNGVNPDALSNEPASYEYSCVQLSPGRRTISDLHLPSAGSGCQATGTGSESSALPQAAARIASIDRSTVIIRKSCWDRYWVTDLVLCVLNLPIMPPPPPSSQRPNFLAGGRLCQSTKLQISRLLGTACWTEAQPDTRNDDP